MLPDLITGAAATGIRSATYRTRKDPQHEVQSEMIALPRRDLGDLYAESGQTLHGSFSVVKPIFASNARWKALAEIYTMHSFAPFSNLKNFVKNCSNVCYYVPLFYILSTFADFCKFLANFAGIYAELRVVSNLIKIKCDLIFGCKIY